jgi:hypothetical protein
MTYGLRGWGVANMDLNVWQLHTMGLDGDGASHVECKSHRQHEDDK